jgi:WD40 repeat protein
MGTLTRQGLTFFLVVFLLGITIAPVRAAQAPRSSMFSSSTWRPLPGWDYDGKHILGHIGHDVYLWDAQTGNILQRFLGHKERIDSVQFSPDGRYILSGSWQDGGEVCFAHLPELHSKDTSVRLWNLKDGREIWKLEGQVGGRFSPDGKRLLTFSLLGAADPDCAGGDVDVAMWDVASGRRIFLVRAHMTLRGTLAFSPNGRTFYASWGQNLVLYDARNGHEIGRIARSKTDAVVAVSFYGSDGAIVTINPAGFNVWDSTLQPVLQPRPINIKSPGYGVIWSHSGNQAISMSQTRTLGVGCAFVTWIVNSGKVVNTIPCSPQANVFEALLMSPDNQHLVASWRGGTVGDEYILSGISIYDLDGKTPPIEIKNADLLLGLSPDGKTFLTGKSAFTVYSTTSGEVITTLHLQGTESFNSSCRQLINCEP